MTTIMTPTTTTINTTVKSMTCFSANCVFACTEVFCFDLISLAKKQKTKLKQMFFLFFENSLCPIS